MLGTLEAVVTAAGKAFGLTVSAGAERGPKNAASELVSSSDSSPSLWRSTANAGAAHTASSAPAHQTPTTQRPSALLIPLFLSRRAKPFSTQPSRCTPDLANQRASEKSRPHQLLSPEWTTIDSQLDINPLAVEDTAVRLSGRQSSMPPPTTRTT